MIKHDYADQKRCPARSSRTEFLMLALVFILCCVEFF